MSFLTSRELETKGVDLQENERSQVSLEDGVQSSLLGLSSSLRDNGTPTKTNSGYIHEGVLETISI